jgi:chromosome segregation ATPase
MEDESFVSPTLAELQKLMKELLPLVATDATKEKFNEFKELLKIIESMIVSLQTQNSAYCYTISALRREQQALERQKKADQLKIESLKAQFDSLQKELNDNKSDNDKRAKITTALITGLKEENAELAKQIAIQVKELKESQNMLLQLFNTLEESTNKFTKEEENKNKQLETARAELKTARAELKSVRTELKSARAKLGTALADLGTARADLETTRADQGTARADLETARADIGTALETTQAELGTTQAELETARAELETAQADLENASSMNQKLRNSNEDLKKNCSKMKTEIIVLNERIISYSKEHQTKNKKQSEKQQKQQRQQRLFLRLLEKIKTLKTEYEEFKSNVMIILQENTQQILEEAKQQIIKIEQKYANLYAEFLKKTEQLKWVSKISKKQKKRLDVVFGNTTITTKFDESNFTEVMLRTLVEIIKEYLTNIFNGYCFAGQGIPEHVLILLQIIWNRNTIYNLSLNMDKFPEVLKYPLGANFTQCYIDGDALKRLLPVYSKLINLSGYNPSDEEFADHFRGLSNLTKSKKTFQLIHGQPAYTGTDGSSGASGINSASGDDGSDSADCSDCAIGAESCSFEPR